VFASRGPGVQIPSAPPKPAGQRPVVLPCRLELVRLARFRERRCPILSDFWSRSSSLQTISTEDSEVTSWLLRRPEDLSPTSSNYSPTCARTAPSWTASPSM
jgi:hypothetical protein